MGTLMIRRKLSIITAAYAPLSAYFHETIRSVEQQTLPSGWDVEWLVQEDGEKPGVEGMLIDVPFAKYTSNKAHTGIAATRNLALTRATGDVVQMLDHDDILLPGALETLLPHFEDENTHWVVGQADDLLSNGERRNYESALPFGKVEPGAVNDWAIKHDGNWPIHCAGLLMRTQMVRAFGGWGGSPVDDDIIMFSALSECTAGMNEKTTTWLYRIHDRQTHKSAQWRERSRDGRQIALDRVRAIRAIGLSITGGGADVPPLSVGPAAKDSAEGSAWWKGRP
ncbi:glycosyltransferase family 2 protein [Actinokineospora pegani]|uniref:glycosyltransferase family 2 protein n=1 Tax=Actinokineospora pegani TaxID=2654637 RepID=UPI001F1E048C|nr:glycosyltransferase family A protein [Actinokineospora pegani]